jgi:hypothetical protein
MKLTQETLAPEVPCQRRGAFQTGSRAGRKQSELVAEQIFQKMDAKPIGSENFPFINAVNEWAREYIGTNCAVRPWIRRRDEECSSDIT